jgi:glyoxylase-like metal-dependent hydrolase (beta-lactamase superfamily II)
MKRYLFVLGLLACTAALTPAQTQAPYPPFTAEQARLGKQLIATTLEIRKGITNNSLPAEPYKIIGNLYFVGDLNGEAYLLTSPQGDILMGTGDADSVGNIQKNIESLGFKLTDIKAIIVNHNHGDQSGGAASMKEKTGAPLMAAFGEIPYIEHGMFNPPAIPAPPPPPAADGTAPRGPQRFPSAHVDRALFDGDVVKVGPLSVRTYLTPGHSPASTTFAYTVRDGGRNYKVVEFCCWEYPDDLSRNAYITEATVRHTFDTLSKLYPVDIYLETSVSNWSGMLSQPSGTLRERMAAAKANPKLFVNREIFNDLTAAREVEFEEKLAKLKAANR